MTERRTQPTATGGGRCLLCLPAGHDAPLALLDGLRTRGAAVAEVADAPAAMLELTSGRFAVLIVIEPDAQRSAEQLVRAARRYVEGVVVWRFSTAAAPMLQPWSDEPMASAVADPSPEHLPAPPAEPPAEPLAEPRVTASADEEADDHDPPQGQPAAPHTIEIATLSEEELAMLLDDGEPSDSQRRSS